MRCTGASSESPQNPWPLAMRIITDGGPPGPRPAPGLAACDETQFRVVQRGWPGGQPRARGPTLLAVYSWFATRFQRQIQDAARISRIDHGVHVAARRGISGIEPALIVGAGALDRLLELGRE